MAKTRYGTLNVKVNVLDLYIKLICIFPIVTVVVDGTSINKILFAAILGLQTAFLFVYSLKSRSVILFMILIFNYLCSLIYTEFPLENYNLLFYYPFFVLYTCFCIDNKQRLIEHFYSNRVYFHAIVILWSGIVGISALLPGSYYIKEGGELYFGSFSGSIFRLGQSTVFIQTLVILLIVMERKKRILLYMLLPLYCCLAGSSRAYAVLGLLLFVVAWYLVCENKKAFWFTTFAGGLFLVAVIFSLPIGKKMLYTLESNRYGDFWFRITSSRSVFWLELLEVWNKSPLINKIFGNDMNFTLKTVGLWAHNDFIEIMCSYGLVGLLEYMYVAFRLYRRGYAGACIPGVIKVCVLMVWLVNAFFNMHYTYFCTALSYPCLVLAVYLAYSETNKR